MKFTSLSHYSKCRAIAIDWIWEVCEVKKFEFLCPVIIGILDKYISVTFNECTTSNYQLIIIAVIYIIAEAISKNISFEYCSYITDRAYTDKEVEEMVRKIKNKLNLTSQSTIFKETFKDSLLFNICDNNKLDIDIMDKQIALKTDEITITI